MQQVSHTSKIPVIEVIRGVASISVALFHFANQFETLLPQAIASVGWLGVDAFFVVSGFVIPFSIIGRCYSIRDFPRFMVRRLIRLEPPYLASIALVIVLWHASSIAPGFRGAGPAYDVPQVTFHLFYAIPLTSHLWLSPVYWTLAYEFAFYILVGLFFPFLINRNVIWTVALGVAAEGIIFLWRLALDVHVMEFLVGVLTMRLVCQVDKTALVSTWLAAVFLVLFAVGGVKIAVVSLVTASSILLFYRREFGGWMVAVGGISYSMYLTHTAIGGRIINLGRRFGEGPIYDLGLIGVALVVSVAFSVLFALAIEKPAIWASRVIGLGGSKPPSL